MTDDRTVWDRDLLRTFLQIVVNEVHNMNCIKSKPNKQGWANIKARMHTATGRTWSQKALSHKMDSLRKEYVVWNLLKHKTGGGMDPNHGVIDAPSHWWKEAERDWGKEVRIFKNRPLWFEAEMDIIFSDAAAGTGNLVWPGATAASGAGPAEDLDDVDEEHLGSQASGSRRPLTRQSGDSPSPRKPKKTYANYQLKRLADSLNESVKLRSRLSDRGESDIMGLIAQLKEDGLEEPSDKFCFELKLLTDPTNRACLKACSGPVSRMTWLDFMWKDWKESHTR